MSDTAALISTHQMQELHALLRDHGITGDKTVHDWLNVWLEEHGDDQHPLESRKDLHGATAARMIRDLRKASVAQAAGGLTRALIAVQAELPWVNKTKRAEVPTKSGGKYTYTYADLADVTAAAFPLLVKHGLAFTCCPRITDKGGYELAGVLMHQSGEQIEGALPLHGNDPQALGGAITYMRRYLLGSMLGIVTDDDADARQAMGHQQTREWAGPSTAELIRFLQHDADRAGVTLHEVTAKLRQAIRSDGDWDREVTVEDLHQQDPWVIEPFARQVRAYTDQMVAKREQEAQAAADAAAAEQAAQEAATAAETTPDPSDPEDPWANPGPGATGEQPPEA